jgi:hypothetical protein
MTWNYKTQFDGDNDIPVDWIWERLRNRRNELLSQSDFRMIADAPWEKAAWATYRQALRDLPNSITNPADAVFPSEPA